MYPLYNRAEDGILVKQKPSEEALNIEKLVWANAYNEFLKYGLNTGLTKEWAMARADQSLLEFKKRFNQ